MEYSNGTAEAYRYHHVGYDTAGSAAPFVGQPNTAFCTNGLLPPADGFHLNGSTPPTRRFHPYGEQQQQQQQHPHHQQPQQQHPPASAPETNGYTNGFVPTGTSHNCDHCGAAFDSALGLSEHVQAHHYAHGSNGAYTDTYPPPSGLPGAIPTKTETSEAAAEILDLDSHKVHVYQPPGSVPGLTLPFQGLGGGLAPTPPYTPATSIGSAGSNSSSVGWMTPTPPLPSLAPPPQQLHPHEYRPNPYPAYELTNTVVNGNSMNGGSGINSGMGVNGSGSSNSNAMMKSSPGWKPSPPPTGGGNHGGGSEARRPKTYNCEACNKWFTSSGHLKRHYNTTLHKNAIKASGGVGTHSNGTANGNGHVNGNNDASSLARSSTPSSRSTGTPNGVVNSPAGSDETSRAMEDMPMSRPCLASPKLIPASPNGTDYRPPPLMQPQQHQMLPGPPHHQVSHQQQYPGPAYQQQLPQQQQQQIPMDPYRTPYASLPGSNQSAPSGSMPYYCPPGGNPSYPPVGGYAHHHQQQSLQQHQQQQLGYPTSTNTLGYPPNSNAPPPSSNGQQLAAGPTASRGIIHSQFNSMTPHHDQQPPLPPFNNNNVDVLKEDPDTCGMIKSHESDFSGGGGSAGGSEGSPDGSDDASLDVSDSEEPPPEKMAHHTLAPPVASYNNHLNNNNNNNNNNGSSKPVGKRNIRGVITPTPSDIGATAGIFKCTLCDKAFNRVCYLTQHNNTFHKGDKPFKCHLCGKRFPNAELFDQHQQKHAGDKPYKCPLCPKQFNHKTDLRRHMCLHTGQKPFMCQVCSKGFIRKDHMVKHVQTHTRRNALHAQPTTS